MGTVQASEPALPTVTLGFAAAGGTPSGSVPGVEQSRDQDLIEDVTDANDGRLVVVVSVSGVTAAATGSRLGGKYYSAAGVIVYTFTTAGDTFLGDMTAGRLKFYWRELK
jgi:hypothetical protein